MTTFSVSPSTRPTALLAALCVTASLVACDSPGADPTTLSGPDLGKADTVLCAGEAPTCLSGCEEAAVLGRATCEGARWSCERGIRDTLCCDADVSPDYCPEWGSACDEGCPNGYTCVKSRTFPVPWGEPEGICRLGELDPEGEAATCSEIALTPPELLELAGPGFLKIEGMVVIEYKCEDRNCSEADPCCQQCTGSYRVSLGDDELGEPIVLPIRTESVSCIGTNCGFTCSPMQPGRRYRLWGTFTPGNQSGSLGTLYLSGSCPL